MNLVVFALDGTLTTTFAVDAQCFKQALRTAFNLERVNPNWLEYRHVTDSGVRIQAIVGILAGTIRRL